MHHRSFHRIHYAWDPLIAMLFLGACMKRAPTVNGDYSGRNQRSTVVHVEA